MYQIGDLVLSRKGRDQKRNFMVVEIIDESYVMIADGKLRPLTKPKKKKIKHLEYIGSLGDDVVLMLKESKLTNPKLSKVLKNKSEG